MERESPSAPKASRRQNSGSLIFTVALLGLIAIAIEAAKASLGFAVVGSVLVAVLTFHYLFRGSRFFTLALANLIGVYACIFLFFVESNFIAVRADLLWGGFLAPIVAFVGGTVWRRASIAQVVFSSRVSERRHFTRVLRWLAPVSVIGAVTFALPETEASAVAIGAIFASAMGLISAVVLLASRDVAIFLLDTGLLFEEFFERAARLAAPAFAFLTFYSLMVIVFGALFSLIDRYSGLTNFRIENVARPITFSESLYFSIATLSTVGYGDIVPVTAPGRVLASMEIVSGVLLLLFGVNEIINYSRKRGD